MKDIEVLIVPDVHGRSFWKEAVKRVLTETKAHIVFLGDYLDPYPDEWNSEDDEKLISINRFKEIIELKKNNPNRITLLLGNHDCGYCIGDDICDCRMDRVNRREIEGLFKDNTKLFQIAEERDINGKHFVFSHAGILKGWVELVWGEKDMNRKGFNVVNELNNAWLVGHYGILDSLGNYDKYRGWGGFKYGSPVWSDIRSWTRITPEETYGYNIVGHTRCYKPIVLETIAMLDVSECFYIDSNGNLRNYNTDEIQNVLILDKNDLDEED